ncbi:MAG: efflux transporter outer membrane subunit [Chloroflexi bacterium]|nr:efflux transporter outer membrane subunit [Chloroflexota bacterium]
MTERGLLRGNKSSAFLPKGSGSSFAFCLLIILSILLPLITSCKKTEYKRPDVQIPQSYRGSTEEGIPQPGPSASEMSLGDFFWWDVLQDDVLKDMIRTALVQNYDVRLAAERIIEAQARIGVARSQQYPNVSGTANYQAGKVSTVGTTIVPPGVSPTSHSYTAAIGATFELDFWGRLSRATDAARAELLATEEARNTVLMTLVSEVATHYLTLRELDMELEISRNTLESRNESYRLVKSREEGGVGTMLDVDQSRTLVLSAQSVITVTEQKIAQEENYLSFLLGKNPEDIPRGKPLTEQLGNMTVPPGLPSSLIESRPDIRQAEMKLIAANAQIDVARAAYFPQIILTGAGGTQSKQFSNLFTGPANTWSFVPQLTVPIFTAGGIRSQVEITKSQQRQLVIDYQRTVQNAFREVSDDLVGYSKMSLYRKQQEELTTTSADQSRLSNLRYVGGVTSYLEVLDTERQYFEAELSLARAQLQELLYLIKLYKALGGGWKQQ